MTFTVDSLIHAAWTGDDSAVAALVSASGEDVHSSVNVARSEGLVVNDFRNEAVVTVSSPRQERCSTSTAIFRDGDGKLAIGETSQTFLEKKNMPSIAR